MSARAFHCHAGGGAMRDRCRDVCAAHGFAEASEPAGAHFSIAPLLTEKIGIELYTAPALGTLIFHPSALPHRRGPDAIRWAMHEGDRVSAATWFWCAEGYDTGDICEQEVVVLRPGERPRDAYERRFIPAAIRALDRAVAGIAAGQPRRVPQESDLATYQGVLRRRGA